MLPIKTYERRNKQQDGTKKQEENQDAIPIHENQDTNEDNTNEETEQQQQSTNHETLETRRQRNLEMIDNMKKIVGELLDEELPQNHRKISSIKHFDEIQKKFQTFLAAKKKAKQQYYIDEARINWMERFIKSFKNFITNPEIKAKRQATNNDEQPNKKKKSEPKIHGQDSLPNKDEDETPEHWTKAPTFVPEYVILVNKVGESIDDIKKHLQELIIEQPELLGQVTELAYSIKGVKVVCATDEIRTRIAKNLAKIDQDLEIKPLDFINPKVIVMAVQWPTLPPKTKAEFEKYKEKIADNIIKANGINKTNIQNSSKPIKVNHAFQLGKSQKIGLIIEMVPSIRSWLQQKKGKLYIASQQYEVEDSFDLKICYNCKRFGHSSGKCNSAKRCQYCSFSHGGPCPKENEKEKWLCSTCGKKGHMFATQQCQAYIKILTQVMRKVNYPYDWLMRPKNGQINQQQQ